MSPLRVLAFAPAAAGQPSPAVRAVPAAAPPPAAALAAWRDAGASIWLDATDPGPDELDSLVDALDLEDVPELPAAGGGATARPRPRLARYDHSASLRLYVPHPGALALGPVDDLPGARARRRTRAGRPASGSAGAAAADVRVVTGSLTLLDPLLIYFGPRFLLTVHDHPLPLLDGVAERARAAGATRAVNTATLLHDVLVAQLDASGDVLDHLAEIAESREAATFGTGPQARRALRSLGRVRRDLFSLRRIATAQRSALTVLARDPTIIPHAPGDGDAPTFEGVLDRAVRLEQAIAVQHGLMISARAAHHSWVAAGVTRVTRRLLIVTCLVAVPTLVVSVYGMNFAGQPELSLGIGHLWAILVALSVDGGLWLYLRHRHWV